MTSKTPKFLAAAAVALVAVGVAPSSYATPKSLDCDKTSDWMDIQGEGKQARIAVDASATSTGWTVDGSTLDGPTDVPRSGDLKVVRIKDVGGSEAFDLTFAKEKAEIKVSISVQRKKNNNGNYKVSAEKIGLSGTKWYPAMISCHLKYETDANAFQYGFTLN